MNSTSTPPVCPDCGAALPADAPDALCAACLLRQALVSRTLAGDDGPSAMPPPSPEEIAGKFPQFEIIECLGRGGMGVVYKARQKSLDRWVAIKILPPERVGEMRFAERFAREAQTLARLNHPNIVTVFDYGETDGLFYIVMEYIDGVNLRDLLRDGKLEPKQALAIVPPICDALQYAHDKGIVHRDIKPENLLLDRDGRIKIADFGIATLVAAVCDRRTSEDEHSQRRAQTAATVQAGTHGYSAPEQATGSADHRADIYALGVVLYEMLTGERPNKELVAPSKKVEIDVRLDEIVLRALEKTPTLRYQTAAEFRTVLETMASMSSSSLGDEAPTEKPKAEGGFHHSRAAKPADELPTFIPALYTIIWLTLCGTIFSLALSALARGTGLWILSGMAVSGALAVLTVIYTQRLADPALRRKLLITHRDYEYATAILLVALGFIATVAIVHVQRSSVDPDSWWWFSVVAMGLAAFAVWIFKQSRRAGNSVQSTPTAIQLTPRFSRTAILGAFFAGLCVAAMILPIKVYGIAATAFVTTLLGWITVAQIRRSAGKLHGMWLAVFDGLLFPLLAVDAAVILPVMRYFQQANGYGMIPVWAMLQSGLGMIALIASNVLIIRSVWRKVNSTVVESSAPRKTIAVAAVWLVMLPLMVWIFSGKYTAWKQEKLRIALEHELGNLIGTLLAERRTTCSKFAFAHESPNAPWEVVVHCSGLESWRSPSGESLTQPRKIKGDIILNYQPPNEWSARGTDDLIGGGTTWNTVTRGFPDWPESSKNAESVPASSQNLSFGPAMARVVNEMESGRGDEALCLRSGKLSSLPGTVQNPWLTNNAIDLLVDQVDYPAKTCRLAVHQMTLGDLKNDAWESNSLSLIETALASGSQRLEPGKSKAGWTAYEWPGKESLPATFAFRSSSGQTGLLQITGFTENPGGVKICYKLVQTEPGTPPRPQPHPAGKLPEQAPLKVTKAQVAQIEALLKKGPVTTDMVAAIWEHDETSGSSYRQRADLVAIPILPAEKSGPDSVPLGQVFRQLGGTAFYVQWDSMGASTLHYYGPYDAPGDVATALAAAIPAAPQAPFQTMSDRPPTSRRTSLDIRISATARSITPVSLTHKNDRTDTLVLPIVIENRSQQTITADLAREWYGGEWPPTDIGAAVRRLGDPAAQWRVSEVFLVGEEGSRNAPTTWQPGQSHDFQLRMNWAGTGSVKGTPLMDADKPGNYAVKLSLVFKSGAGLEYFESDEMEVTVEAKTGAPSDSTGNTPLKPSAFKPIPVEAARLLAELKGLQFPPAFAGKDITSPEVMKEFQAEVAKRTAVVAKRTAAIEQLLSGTAAEPLVKQQKELLRQLAERSKANPADANAIHQQLQSQGKQLEAMIEAAAGRMPEKDYIPRETPEPGRISLKVSGAVARPGTYSLRGDATLLDALAAAGGWSEDANLGAVSLIGPDSFGKLDVEGILASEWANPELAGFSEVVVPHKEVVVPPQH